VQWSLAVRATGSRDAHHEGACQRHRYNSEEQWPAKAEAQHEKDCGKRHAENGEFYKESLPSLEDSENVQFEIARHFPRVAGRSSVPLCLCVSVLLSSLSASLVQAISIRNGDRRRNGDETVRVIRFGFMRTYAGNRPGSRDNDGRNLMARDKAFLPIQYDIRTATAWSAEANIEKGLRSQIRTGNCGGIRAARSDFGQIESEVGDDWWRSKGNRKDSASDSSGVQPVRVLRVDR
jgi:hypothetical protein